MPAISNESKLPAVHDRNRQAQLPSGLFGQEQNTRYQDMDYNSFTRIRMWPLCGKSFNHRKPEEVQNRSVTSNLNHVSAV
jgi:hypothetical protein